MSEPDPKLLNLESALAEMRRLREELGLPFPVRVLGVDADVEKVDMTLDGQIFAICRRGKTRQKIPILDLPLPAPAPAGVEWIVAYRHWRRGSW
jgi:hypothetical protein